jgi:hypothetical protein
VDCLQHAVVPILPGLGQVPVPDDADVRHVFRLRDCVDGAEATKQRGRSVRNVQEA